KDRKAGIYLHKKVGDPVSEGEGLFTVYAEKEDKLEEAVELAEKTESIRVRSREESLVEQV
ncbi:MAG: AMP phosphorylase, partial [Candidatus Nanohaloarchaea archaeon]|nr:AMP phosphorylase [Candidatus Nanohaloarchaea archaeon]